MIGLFYSPLDPASLNMAEHIKKEYGFEEKEYKGRICFSNGKICIYKTEKPLVEMEEADAYDLSIACFLSKHSSAQGIASFTTHSMGNWTNEAKLGGKPYELSSSAPLEMLETLRNIKKREQKGVEVSYEATHHGPFLKTPSLFAEIGGNQETVENKEYAKIVADSLYDALMSDKIDYSKIAIGIGSNHYPSKFSNLALEKGYAFAYIMPKHAIEEKASNAFMLEQAIERSSKKIELAVIDWKSINSEKRNLIISKLNELGVDYERV